MKKITTSLLSLSLVGLLAFAPSDSVKLRLDLPQGATYNVTAQMKMNFFSDKAMSEQVMSQDMDIMTRVDVLEKAANKHHTLGYTVERVKMTTNAMGQRMNYDSDATDESNPMSASLSQQFKPILKKEMRYTLNERGGVEESAEMEEELEQLTSIEQLFTEFPERALNVGDSWEDQQNINTTQSAIEIKLKYTVKEITKKTVVLSVELLESDLSADEDLGELNLDMGGTTTYERKTGMMLSSTMSQQLKMNNAQMGEIFVLTNMEMTSEKQ